MPPVKKNFEKQTIRILRAVPPEKDRGIELAIIRWLSDGNAHVPQLVGQEVYTDRLDRKRKYGKVKGLKWGDWKFLTETPQRIEEISDLLMDMGPGATRRHEQRRPSGQDAAANDLQDLLVPPEPAPARTLEAKAHEQSTTRRPVAPVTKKQNPIEDEDLPF